MTFPHILLSTNFDLEVILTMRFLSQIWKYVLPVVRNKYIFTIILFFCWLLIFDNNNLIDRSRHVKQLNQLEKEKQYYLDRIDYDSRKMEELKTDKDNLEKFAREQYLMKKENEDIYIVVDRKD
jgi:cell division protein FtsB